MGYQPRPNINGAPARAAAPAARQVLAPRSLPTAYYNLLAARGAAGRPPGAR